MQGLMALLGPMVMNMMRQGGGKPRGSGPGRKGGAGMAHFAPAAGGKEPAPESSTARNALRKQMHRKTPTAPMPSPLNWLDRFGGAPPVMPAAPQPTTYGMARMPYAGPDDSGIPYNEGTPWDY